MRNKALSASGRVTARTTIEIEEPSANEREYYVAGQPDTDIVGTTNLPENKEMSYDKCFRRNRLVK